MRVRHIAAVALVLGLTVVGFIVARAIAERDARSDSERRAEVAAAQIRGRVAQATSLTESLRRFMLDSGGTGVSSDQFARNALRWLSPADFPAAAWAEEVRAGDRAAYERRIGQRMVTPSEPHSDVPPGSAYLPATLVSGFPPMDLRGIDLRREPGVTTALRRSTSPGGVAATPIAPRGGASGLFLVAAAPNLVDGVLRAGAVVVFVSEQTLRAAAEDPAGVRLAAAGSSSGLAGGGHTVRRRFTVAGQQFDVVVPKESVSGPAAVLPWIILAGGLVLAALAAGLGLNATRRAKAQQDLDRIFNMSHDAIAVSDFHGYFKRVNPAAERILGYSREELLARPYVEFVHPDDRERTAAETETAAHGKTTLSFENRYIRKDGSQRVLEWTSTPVVEDGVAYAVARDITERRRAEEDVQRLAEEQAALRRVATLVGRGMDATVVFGAVADEVEALFGAGVAVIVRYESGESVLVVGAHGGANAAGARVPLDPDYIVAEVRRTGAVARFDTDDPEAPGMPALVRAHGVRSGLASPIVVDGKLWGAVTVGSLDRPLPPGAEHRLGDFTELIATAISNTQARADLQLLADEQAALRRVATLVAELGTSSELFEMVTREVGTLLGGDFAAMARFEDDGVVTVATWAAAGEHPPVPPRWDMQPGDPATTIAETRQAARWNDWDGVPGDIAEFIRGLGIRSTVGTPIVVEGRIWGALALHSMRETPLPPDTEPRMAQFTDLVATAVANAEARGEVARLADEQAALRRVATLIAREASQAEIFAAIAEESGQLIGTEEIRVLRYEDEHRAILVVGSAGSRQGFSLGSHQALDGTSVAARVNRTGRTARIDDYGTASGTLAEKVRSIGVRSAVGAPIVVEGQLWGAIVAGSTRREPLPADTERRLGQFTDLIATAIANADSRAQVERLADEQAALRQVATLVAEGVQPAQLFTAVTQEVARLFANVSPLLLPSIIRFDPGPEFVLVGSSEPQLELPIGSRWGPRDLYVSTRVQRTGRSARVDQADVAVGGVDADLLQRQGFLYQVGSPIVVEGHLWGAMTMNSSQPLPPDTAQRLESFTELVATAIANTESREGLRELAEEQAALRRVATLVAEGASPTAVFDAVAAEMGGLLDADGVFLSRYEPDSEVTVLAHWGSTAPWAPPGTRMRHDGKNVTSLVRNSGRPARMHDYEQADDAIAKIVEEMDVSAIVGAPIVVDGRLWGLAGASWRGANEPPPDAEDRMAKFTQLLDTAVANADSRDQLTASRARLLTAGDDARRRVVRDLHDGAQQRLVHTIVNLKLAQRELGEEDGKARSLVADALQQAEQGNAELRELAHGILPAVLTRGGLRAGVTAFVDRLDLPVEVDVPGDRFEPEIEASAYFIVAEALNNVLKHSQAGHAEVSASVGDGTLRVEVRDDGVGGAERDGHGLVGIADRATALGGRLDIESPDGGGTLVTATLPLPG